MKEAGDLTAEPHGEIGGDRGPKGFKILIGSQMLAEGFYGDLALLLAPSGETVSQCLRRPKANGVCGIIYHLAQGNASE